MRNKKRIRLLEKRVEVLERIIKVPDTPRQVKVLNYLKEVGSPQTVLEIACSGKLPRMGTSSIYPVLTQLLKKGVVIKTGWWPARWSYQATKSEKS
jgi:DNA-binding PadR family transcriptional regulator